MSRRERVPSISCPACKARAMVRTSAPISDTVREVRFLCSDDECGHYFVGQVIVTRTIRPSAKPKCVSPLPVIAATQAHTAPEPMPILDYIQAQRAAG